VPYYNGLTRPQPLAANQIRKCGENHGKLQMKMKIFMKNVFHTSPPRAPLPISMTFQFSIGKNGRRKICENSFLFQKNNFHIFRENFQLPIFSNPSAVASKVAQDQIGSFYDFQWVH
jgi:hypothetical protein